MVGLGLVAGIAYLTLASGGVSHERVYRIGYNQNPPFQIRTADGHASGFAVETVAAAARRSGIKLQWVFDETLTANALRTQAVDLWPLLADIPERRQWAHVSDSWIVSDNYLIVRGSVDQLPGPDFDGEVHYSGPAIMAALMRQKWPKVRPASVLDRLQMVPSFCSGAWPLVFVSSHQATNFLREAALLCPSIDFRAHHLPELTIRLGVASTHEASAVADRLRAEILKMGQDGALGRSWAATPTSG